MGGQSDDDEEHPAEEARRVKVVRDPSAPTKAERDAHEATHLPFRVWCTDCINGRRDNPPHIRTPNAIIEVPEVLFDYCFVRKDDEEETITILLMKDRQSRAIRAWVVPHKGVDLDGTVERAVQGINELGHRGRVTIKTDGEPALIALRDALIAKLPEGAAPIGPPAGESQSNGAIENGVKVFKGFLRVHLGALERKTGGKIPSKHPLLTWLVEHAADVVTKYLQASDGRTGYERLFGKQVHEEGLEFGERVHYKKRKGNDYNVVLDARWAPGVWLGRKWGGITHRIATEHGVVEARAVQRRPLTERWSMEELAAVRATPWCFKPGPAGENEQAVIFQQLPAAPVGPQAQAPPEYQPRRVFIRPEDLERWGFSANCKRCLAMREGRSATGPHHAGCRDRIEKAMREAGDDRVTKADERITEELYRRSVPMLRDDVDAAAVAGTHDHDSGGAASSGNAAAAANAEPQQPQSESMQVEVSEPAEMIDFLGRSVPPAVAREATSLYECLLVHGASAAQAQSKIVELYSPPRVTEELGKMPRLSLSAGSTFDLREGRDGRAWDFTKEADRRAARAQIQHEKPYLVIGSPPCTTFCALNVRWNYPKMPAEEVARRKAVGRMLFGFAVEIYDLQVRAGRHFLHEHPASATSWQERSMQDLCSRPGVSVIVGDQCRYGLQARGKDGVPGPAMKPTKFASSAVEVLRELGQRCKRNHEHVPLLSGRAAAAAVYPPGLCRAILKGIDRQQRREGQPTPASVAQAVENGTGIYELGHREGSDAAMTVDGASDEAHIIDEDAALLHYGSMAAQWAPEEEGKYWDANTGEPLPSALARAARREELDFMIGWGVWDEVPVEECRRVTNKNPLGGKWVDVNKGDAAAPLVRCRYVAKEIAFTRNDDFFAATPPLEALRLLVSHAASNRDKNLKLMVMDARKAHLHAMAERDVFVDLPPELRRPGFCAKLRRCLYGTRDAPARWEAYLTGELAKMGFVRGLASPCCFYNAKTEVQCIVHGDDFVFVGTGEDLSKIEKQMQTGFLIKLMGRLGGDASDCKELCILNRVLRWTPGGIRYEADPRHAEILVKSLTDGLHSIGTPGVRLKPVIEEDEPLPEYEARLFRSSAARANYLGLDRPDVAFAAKELCRRMGTPTRTDLEALRRLAKFLAGRPRIVYQFNWQEPCQLDVYVDTDFAGCAETRRSTSGGCALHGGHLLKHWATTQKVVTLSSGEAELAGVVKGVGEALGLQSFARDLGIAIEIRVHADSSAAIGICRRSGIGRVRHLAVGQLWVQERLKVGDFALHKVAGEMNPADLLTKHVPREGLAKHCAAISVLPEAGRATSAPAVSAEVDATLASL